MESVRELVALLVASYPWTTIDPATPRAYELALADLPAAELADVVKTLVVTRPRFPSVAEIRELAVERRLGLPAPIEAWALASRYAAAPARVRCETCHGYGVVVVGEPEPVEVPADLAASSYRDELERIAAVGLRRTDDCPDCEGGAVPNPDRPALPGPVRDALDAVGGPGALRDPANPETLRAQFLRAYETYRRQAVDHANLASAGLALTRREVPALTEGGPDAPAL